MPTILPSEFKRGDVLMLDGSPYVVEDFHSTGTAQTRHRLHSRLRNLKTGRVIDRIFVENERVSMAEIQTRRLSYSYSQGDTHIFIDSESYDEISWSDELVGERRWFLKENDEYKALLLEGRLMDIVLPLHVALEVTETDPPARGGIESSWKEAELSTGLKIMVPLFIARGDIVKVDTAEKKYAGKESDK